MHGWSLWSLAVAMLTSWGIGRRSGRRFPPEVISYAVWLYHRFTLSFRDVEDLLAERGIAVSYEAVRNWCMKFGPTHARFLRRKQGRHGDIWHVDELFITIRGERRYLWRAVDQDGDVIDILVTKRRDRRAAKRFFLRALKHQGRVPWQLVTDRLRSYAAAHREIFPSVMHRTGRHENNRAEVSHQHTRGQERQMRRFKSPQQSQRFLSVRGAIQNLFRVGATLPPSSGLTYCLGRVAGSIENPIPIGILIVLACEKCPAEAVNWALRDITARVSLAVTAWI